MSLSIVIPTIGRLTLSGTLASFADDLLPEDEVIVVGDGPNDDVREFIDYLAHNYLSKWTYTEIDKAGCWGQPARNHGFDIAQGSHWATIDDDDIYLPGALEAMRDAIHDEPSIPTIFKCKWGPGHFANGVVLWQEHSIRQGIIATPMIVAPASPCRFAHTYDGDYYYAEALKQHFQAFQWDSTIIAEIRPELAITSADDAR